MAVSLSSPSDLEEIPVDEDAALDAPESCGVEYRAKQQRCRVCHRWIASGAWALEQHKAHCNNKTQRLPCPYCGKKVADNANARWQHSKHCQQQRNSDMAWRNSPRYRSERQHAPPMTCTRSQSVRSMNRRLASPSVSPARQHAPPMTRTRSRSVRSMNRRLASPSVSPARSMASAGTGTPRVPSPTRSVASAHTGIRRVPSPIRNVATVFSDTQNVPSPTRQRNIASLLLALGTCLQE